MITSATYLGLRVGEEVLGPIPPAQDPPPNRVVLPIPPARTTWEFRCLLGFTGNISPASRGDPPWRRVTEPKDAC